jgi:phage terminase large subunit-like protein
MVAHRLRWLQQARANQLPPPHQSKSEGQASWHTWLLMAGRGFGKTRAGAEALCWELCKNAGWRGAVVAPTERDARDTCVEGESGILSVLPQGMVQSWNRSQGEILLSNGSRIKLFSADAPERLRGPQHHVAWCDELGAWRSPEALDQLRFGLRLGVQPVMIITTTPRPIPMLKEMLQQVGAGGVVLSSGHTFENAANLAPSALAELRRRYEGTRLGRQELYAELLEDVQGALWPRRLIDLHRITAQCMPELQRVVVAVDPAVTSGAQSDATGIVAVGLGVDGHAYVLHDATCRDSPENWARRVSELYHSLQADLVIGEVNQGGDLVESVLRASYAHLPFKAVRALRGKALRAEPVAALYERGLVHHVGFFAPLEDEMSSFVPGADYAQKSPDRMDALVWAITELMLGAAPPRVRCV